MLSRIIFLLLTTNLYYLSFGQESNRCDLIDVLLHHNEARKVFYFDEHKDVPIVFVDTYRFFEGCSERNHSGRKVIFISDSSQAEVANYSNIVITNFKKTSKRYKVSLFYKIRNAFFSIEFKKKQRKIIVFRFTGGYF